MKRRSDKCQTSISGLCRNFGVKRIVMAGVRRRILEITSRLVTSRGFKMSAQLRAEKAVEEMKKANPYFEKYADKIAALQQTSPEEFLKRVEAKEEKEKRKREPERKYSELLNPKQKLDITNPKDTEKRLDDIMKLDLIADKSPDDIKHIWFEYHKNKDVVVATIPVEQYEKLTNTGKVYPVFIFPLPRSEGYEFIMLQFSGNTIHFTPLIAYQVHKENAPECLSIVHYTELKGKGLILMRGEYDSKVLNPQEAQCLANQLQLYYCKGEESKLKLMETFNKQPDTFKHMDLITEMENIKIE